MFDRIASRWVSNGSYGPTRQIARGIGKGPSLEGRYLAGEAGRPPSAAGPAGGQAETAPRILARQLSILAGAVPSREWRWGGRHGRPHRPAGEPKPFRVICGATGMLSSGAAPGQGRMREGRSLAAVVHAYDAWAPAPFCPGWG
jgi:hypothetical protein